MESLTGFKTAPKSDTCSHISLAKAQFTRAGVLLARRQAFGLRWQLLGLPQSLSLSLSSLFPVSVSLSVVRLLSISSFIIFPGRSAFIQEQQASPFLVCVCCGKIWGGCW